MCVSLAPYFEAEARWAAGRSGQAVKRAPSLAEMVEAGGTPSRIPVRAGKVSDKAPLSRELSVELDGPGPAPRRPEVEG